MSFYDDLQGKEREEIAEKLKNAFNQETKREYQLVAQNFEEEHRVPTEIRDQFLDNIDGLLNSGTDVLGAIDSAIKEDMLLKAAEIDDADVPNTLARTVPGQDIIDYHLDSNRDQSPAEEYSEEELIEDIKSGGHIASETSR
ncbi:hypothetical protein H8E77_24090 [bacterium]|nr:hypothetical protein [bacterium]